MRIPVANNPCPTLCLWLCEGESRFMTLWVLFTMQKGHLLPGYDAATVIHVFPSRWSIRCLHSTSECLGRGGTEMLVRVLVKPCHTSRTLRWCRGSSVSHCCWWRLLLDLFFSDSLSHLSLSVKVTLSFCFFFFFCLSPLTWTAPQPVPEPHLLLMRLQNRMFYQRLKGMPKPIPSTVNFYCSVTRQLPSLAGFSVHSWNPVSVWNTKLRLGLSSVML